MANLESGRRLADRYLLQERLGDGGHAEVWAALDARDNRRVALKFLHRASCPADDCWNVLQHESAMAQRLDHPGVLRVESPERDGDLVFLPMECAAGGDVRALRGAPWRQVLPVLLQVGGILEHAHSRGVVHRDIKPGNVLFAADGSVRVTDFGTAARTGSTLALADGSPFSASPQQLAGQAATTSDDVYGLGALAYELLSRYPPYYPDFDAHRVQHEMPAPLVAAHPAPPRLLAYIMSMLEREPQHRPDLREVIDFFTQCLEQEPTAPQSGAAMMVSESQPRLQVGASNETAGAPAGAMRFAAMGLAAAALAAVALFVFMPAPSPPLPVKPVPVAVASAGAGVAAAPVQPPAADTPDRDAAPTPVAQELAAGQAALVANQPAVARAAFERALLREPGNAAARAGIAAAEKISRMLDAYSAAMRAETGGDLETAKSGYAAALALDRGFAPAQAGMARVQDATRAQAFEAALAQAAAALAAGRVDVAEAQYQRAATLGGEDARVKEGRQRIAEIRRSDLNARDLARGAQLENEEQWKAALDHYQSVLGRDDSLQFAIDGLARSTRRDELDRELQDYFDRPDRLVAPAVRAAAHRALARGEATAVPKARLGTQLRELKGRLDALEVKVPVQITSDGSTLVFVATVGELGTFAQRELELPPGQYTVIGRREGFRDVRRELTLLPGQQRTSISVQCTERI
jgi:tetratricopeptide (TPR) repeat protein